VISIEALERMAVPGWRAAEEGRLGDWLLRAAAGFTGRANSVLAIGDPGMPVAAAAEYVRDWYRTRGLPAMIAVPYPAGEPHRSPLDLELSRRGWTVRSGPATVMVAAASDIEGDPAGVELDPAPDDAWLARYHYRGQRLPPVAIRLLTSAPWQSFASVRRAGETVAIGRVAAAGGWAGLTAIEVDPLHRRRGLGAAVTAALAAAAARHGARQLYLQVEDDNAARSLYARIGFTEHHGYHYRVALTSS
jgi:N-acetylglutamate synthase